MKMYGGGFVAQSCPTLATPWTLACQAPLSMGFSRQEYWGGLPCPPPEDLPGPGIEPTSLTSLALAGGLFATLWTVAHQAALSRRSSRQEYWGGLPCPLPGDLLNPGIEPKSPSLQVDSLPSELPGKPLVYILLCVPLNSLPPCLSPLVTTSLFSVSVS